MKSLTPAQITCIVILLDQGKSGHQIHHITGISTGTISKIHSSHSGTLPKSTGGHSCKLSPSDVHYTICLITSQKEDNATGVAKSLENVVEQPVSIKTI